MTSTAFRQSSKLRSRGKSILVFNGTITGTSALATGSGTENDPYQISSAEGLKWFRDKVNNAKTPDETKICAVLTADIDLNNEEWTPIGPSESSAYTGTFDGQGHTVRNLSITGDVKRAGLFGCVIGGAIRKLTVAGSVSCTVDQGWCGGIAGYAERETIENCASLCTVSYTGKDARVGGIVGYVPSSSSMTIICDCYNIGNITGSSDTGGICGYNLSGRIFNCYNVGEITGGNYVSKIVGYGQANNNPTNCYYLSDTDTDPAAKTAAEFADRTVVLKLLKAGRNDSPWDSCQYVATAGITLPVFNGQGDAHNANGGRQEQLRVTKQLFVVSELLVGQAAKFLPGKTANKEIARDNIIILKGTVQRQTIHFARIVADKRHIVLWPWVYGLHIPTDKLLKRAQLIHSEPFFRMLARLNIQNTDFVLVYQVENSFLIKNTAVSGDTAGVTKNLGNCTVISYDIYQNAHF